MRAALAVAVAVVDGGGRFGDFAHGVHGKLRSADLGGVALGIRAFVERDFLFEEYFFAGQFIPRLLCRNVVFGAFLCPNAQVGLFEIDVFLVGKLPCFGRNQLLLQAACAVVALGGGLCDEVLRLFRVQRHFFDADLAYLSQPCAQRAQNHGQRQGEGELA